LSLFYKPKLETPYHISGSSGIETMVEDVCFDIASGKAIERGFCESDIKEFKWRNWSPRRFHLKKEACHYEVTVKFTKPDDGYDELNFEIIKVKEIYK
jgi:hypothetical protein